MLKRNNLRSLLLSALFSIFIAGAAQAEIVLQSGAPRFSQTYPQPMANILFVSSAEMNQASYMQLRANTWRNKQNSAGLVFTPGYIGQATAVSNNQANARRHVARAQAFRMDYFK